MSVQRYPFTLKIYKGEGRILIIPVVNHTAGYSVDSDEYVNIQNMENHGEIGEKVIQLVDVIKISPLSKVIPKELEERAVWKSNSKYKSHISFWKNNHFAWLDFFEDGHYRIFSMTKSDKIKGSYSKIIKDLTLSSDAAPEEIGQAVMEVMAASEEYYQDYPVPSAFPSKKLELLDGSMLTVQHPHDKHFEDAEDCHAMEVYQCYSYIPKEDSEASAVFFLGMASELDCNLDRDHVRAVWEEMYGKADSFEMQEISHGMFMLRAEMKSKEIHKVSYLLQMEEDLLLECGMEVHQPNRRKKLDEKLVDLFAGFALDCKMQQPDA